MDIQLTPKEQKQNEREIWAVQHLCLQAALIINRATYSVNQQDIHLTGAYNEQESEHS